MLKLVLDNLNHDINFIVSGGADGADWLAEKYAKEKDIPTLILKPDHKKYGKKAHWVRNSLVVKNSDKIIAFWDGRSPGTEYTINRAKRKGKEVVIKYF